MFVEIGTFIFGKSAPRKKREQHCMGNSNTADEIRESPRGDKLYLSVYFEGTANTIHPSTTQIGLFFRHTKALDVTDPSTTIPPTTTQCKMAFDGCGTTNGTMGVIFAAGLSTQCQVVQTRIDEIIHSGRPVQLNTIGLSRGVIMLMQRLANYRNVSINALLFDPVPGNLISSSYCDILGLTFANQCISLQECTNLNHVVALYPYIPLPDLAFHAPILPKYPKLNSPHLQLEEQVILGCHQGALFHPSTLPCEVSFLIIRQFLTDCGTELVSMDDFEVSEARVLAKMDKEVTKDASSVRYTHSYCSKTIVRKESGTAKYLNAFHLALAQKLGREVSDTDKAMPFLLQIIDG